MYHLCLFVWTICALSRLAGCAPTTNPTSTSDHESISEDEKIQALENMAMLDGDEDRTSGGLQSVRATSSPKWPNGIVDFKIDKKFRGKFF